MTNIANKKYILNLYLSGHSFLYIFSKASLPWIKYCINAAMSDVFQRKFREISRVSKGWFMEISRVFQDCFERGFKKNFSTFLGVSRVFQGWTREFQGNFKKMLQYLGRRRACLNKILYCIELLKWRDQGISRSTKMLVVINILVVISLRERFREEKMKNFFQGWFGQHWTNFLLFFFGGGDRFKVVYFL